MTTKTMLNHRTDKCDCGHPKSNRAMRCQMCVAPHWRTPSPDEIQIAKLFTEGWKIQSIARHLKMRDKNVEYKMSNLRRKLGLTSRLQLIHWCLLNGHARFMVKTASA